jgi:hypothetical protein
MSPVRALLFSVVMLTACAQSDGRGGVVAPPPPPVSMPEPRSDLGRQIHTDMARLDAELRAPGVVAAGAGETADLGQGLTILPLAIIEDSRCPANVACLWAGRMRIRAQVSGRESELTLGETMVTPNGPVAFVVASPSAWAEWPRDELGPRPPYRFGFRRG